MRASVSFAWAGLSALALAGCDLGWTFSGGSGTTGTGGSASSSVSTGAAMSCMVPEDCPAPPECQTATCDAGTCGAKGIAVGTLAASQTPGDCKANKCDGAGAVVAVGDTSDAPADDACGTYTCSPDGNVVPTFAASGTPCGRMLMCDGMGTCVGCTKAGECPASANPCLTAACDASMCVYAPAPNGTVLPDPANDCKKTQCDATGNLLTLEDPTDVPLPDSNACTTQTCSGGVPTYAPITVGNSGAAEGSAPACKTCQGGAYAGTCGYRLYQRPFPQAGAWTSQPLSLAWTGTNAPPPTLTAGMGISMAERTSSGSRLMVFREDGQYYEFFGGAWRTPVPITTRFANLPPAGVLSAGVCANAELNPPNDLFIILTKENGPRQVTYFIPESGAAPVYDSGPAPATPNGGEMYGAPQESFPMVWSFNEQHAVFGTTTDSIVTWKQIGGTVYKQFAGSDGFYYPDPPAPEATSALAINGMNGAPQPGTAVAAYYDNAGKTVFMIAP